MLSAVIVRLPLNSLVILGFLEDLVGPLVLQNVGRSIHHLALLSPPSLLDLPGLPSAHSVKEHYDILSVYCNPEIREN